MTVVCLLDHDSDIKEDNPVSHGTNQKSIIHAVYEVIFQKRVRVFHRGFIAFIVFECLKPR